jgi:hypothetical protein
MTEEEVKRWNELAKQRGINMPAPIVVSRPDWSLLDPFRDVPVADRPKTYRIGGGKRR